MEAGMGEVWLNTGIQAAHILSTHKDKNLVFEHVGLFLFNSLKKAGVTDIRIYVKDEVNDCFRCEVICDDMCIRQGYDIIPLAQIQNTMNGTDDIYQININEFYYYILAPLKHGDKFIGIIEFHSSYMIDEEQKKYLMSFCSVLSLGIHNFILYQISQREKQSINMVTDVSKHLQTMTSIDEITASFANITVKHMCFDRAALFLFDEKQNVTSSYCVDSDGNEYELDSFPDIPHSDEIQELHQIPGYWFPLKTSTGKVGMALFDNAYSSYPFPVWNIDVLSSLCNQFATAVENISLFKNIQMEAQHDKLTNLYNRAFFEETLAGMNTKNNLPLSIIIGDVNGLKVTNDVFGHFEGDHLLIRITELLRQACRPEDVIARWGGDEFIILLPKTDEDEACQICRNIDSSCKSALISVVQLSISLGHAAKTREDEELLLVMKKAEDMMYMNKQTDHDLFKKNFMASIMKYLNDNCLETEEHIMGIKDLALKFSIILGLSDYERENIQQLALFHDLGKIAINPFILNKPERLTPEEWENMRKHPAIGSRIAQSSLGLANIAEEILYHHERWDGKGYPQGKSGFEIPRLSRILAIVDTYDVMTHDRPYKKAISHTEAIAALKTLAGSQFDPSLVNIFCMSFEKGLGFRD